MYIGSYVIYDFIGISTSFFRDSSLIYKILINNCETKNQILYNIVIVVSYHSFDSNFCCLGLSVAKIHMWFYRYTTVILSHFSPIS